ncbi:hypothetical protein DFH09DRAFT_1313218 [Mycena vulgaris]|nr:hypothetical protein DFH09DRAFT_1313218 [Mycena vulgaris]
MWGNVLQNRVLRVGALALRLLAIPLTAALLALFAFLHASATLTRIETALLPADMQPIVPFDRAAPVGSIDLTARSLSLSSPSRSFFCFRFRVRYPGARRSSRR